MAFTKPSTRRAALAALIGGVTALVGGCSPREPGPNSPPRGIEFVSAPSGDVAQAVKKELEAAATTNQTLLVYVSASWCEPCRRFQDAVHAGTLAGHLDGLRLLKFDVDRDEQRLSGAGYDVDMIPLFAIPRPDGTASERYISGSVKGDGAVANIKPRLQRLIEAPR